MSWLVHLSYDLVSGIIVIWLPNQDSGVFGKILLGMCYILCTSSSV
jgi:uncharacterized membrane protein YeaQ/YmgE (transglycosylase-associated protein family)